MEPRVVQVQGIYIPISRKITTSNGAAKDVHQGSLGDCWLMAALSCLSDYPGRLKSLFKDRHITEEGVMRIGRRSAWYLMYIGFSPYDNVSTMCRVSFKKHCPVYILYIYLLVCKVIPCDRCTSVLD